MYLFKFKKKYDFIVSIGQGCATPEILRDSGLRLFSGPFDWTFVENYNITMDVIKNKFENYFNKEDLVFIGHYSRSGMDIYVNKYTNIKHAHSFPSSEIVSFEDAYKTESNRYKRRINRLFDYINKKNSKICFVYIERAFDWEHKKEDLKLPQPDITNEMLEKDIKELNKIYSKDCFDIFYIKHDENKKLNEYKIINHICYMNNSCIDKDNPHKGNMDMLEKIISKQLKVKKASYFIKKIKSIYCIVKVQF